MGWILGSLAGAIVVVTLWAQRRRVAELRALVSDLRFEIRREMASLQESLESLQVEVRRRAGELRFYRTMTVEAALAIHPRAREVLASFHIGGCSDCAVDGNTTIEDAARSAGAEPDHLVKALEGLFLTPHAVVQPGLLTLGH